MIFDLQRFGGKGGTTIQSTYEPTEYELKLQQLEVELTEQVLIPSAKKLGQTAYNSFDSTNANVQDITNTIHNHWLISQQQIDNAFTQLQGSQIYLANSLETLDALTDDIPIANKNWTDMIADVHENYEDYISDYNDSEKFVNNQMKKSPQYLSSAYDDLEDNFENIGGFWGTSTVPSDVVTKFDYNLSNISAENYHDLDKLKPTLASALDINFDDAVEGVDSLTTLGSYYNNLDSLIPEYNENYRYAREQDKIHSNFNDLIDGNLPSQWKTNMRDAIKTTLENTVGEMVSDMSTRGVINSSVHTQAIYDIERNAADEVAKQYLQNIQTVGGLVQNRWHVKEQSLNDQKLVLNELLGYAAQAIGLKLQAKAHEAENIRGVVSLMAQIFTQQFNNSSNAFTQQAGMDAQKYSALNTGLNSQAQLYGEVLNNKTKAGMNAMNWYQIVKNVADTEWAHSLSNLEQLTRMYQLRLQAVSTWDNVWEAVLANSGRKILLSTAAQEAIQQPALRLWNAASGLNQAATGVLVALSNQGTRTQTTHQSGNFLGGVLSAGLTAFAGGFGMTAAKGLLDNKSQ